MLMIMILVILDSFWTTSMVKFGCKLDLRPSPPPSEVVSDTEFSDEDVERLGMDDHLSLCKQETSSRISLRRCWWKKIVLGCHHWQ